MLLALDQQRVQHGAAVVDGDVAQQRDLAGVLVDLDDGDVRAERERRLALVEVELRGQPQRAVGVVDDAVGLGRGGGERRPVERPCWARRRRPACRWSVSTTMSPTSASSRCAARCLALSTSDSVARMHGRAAELQRARAAGAAAAAHQVGVDRDQPDPVDGDAGLVADDHRERGLVALAVRRRAGHAPWRSRRRAPATAPYSLVPPPAVISTYVETPMPSSLRSPLARRARLLGAELVVAGPLGDRVERRVVRAAVVGDAGERREREDVVGQQVAAAQFDRVDAQLDRRLVDDALEQRRRLGPAGAAVRAHRRGVGGGDDDVELDAGEPVGAVGHPPRAGGQERADARDTRRRRRPGARAGR